MRVGMRGLIVEILPVPVRQMLTLYSVHVLVASA